MLNWTGTTKIRPLARCGGHSGHSLFRAVAAGFIMKGQSL